MLTYVRNALASQFDHPIFGLMYIFAEILAAASLLTEYLISIGVTNWRIGAGFMAVFAVFFALVATIGYAVLLVGKGISMARDRVGPAS